MEKKLDEFVAYYLKRLEGPDHEAAFHALIEAPREAVPLLLEAYSQPIYRAVRPMILEVVSHHRDSTVLSFLMAGLCDDQPAIWKQALDGLVTLGGESTVEELSSVKSTLAPGDIKAVWIDEAIEQILG